MIPFALLFLVNISTVKKYGSQNVESVFSHMANPSAQVRPFDFFNNFYRKSLFLPATYYKMFISHVHQLASAFSNVENQSTMISVH